MLKTGEFGADRIYAGQMAVLGKKTVGIVIKVLHYFSNLEKTNIINSLKFLFSKHMWEQEKDHLKKFEELIPKYRVRPSALLPIWNIAGFALGFGFKLENLLSYNSNIIIIFNQGAGTALLGKEAAMACTVAVEHVITEHYNK